jgi:hypothetical protein
VFLYTYLFALICHANSSSCVLWICALTVWVYTQLSVSYLHVYFVLLCRHLIMCSLDICFDLSCKGCHVLFVYVFDLLCKQLIVCSLGICVLNCHVHSWSRALGKHDQLFTRKLETYQENSSQYSGLHWHGLLDIIMF